MAATAEQKRDWRTQFEQMGVNQVRAQLAANQYRGDLLHEAVRWLGEKDHESTRLSDASQAEQTEIARSAKDAAWVAARAAERAADAAEKANTKATKALIIAAISIIVTAISIAVVHYDAIH